ncbi:hypothetical protein MBLNU230_g1510t1 [Neophaeotheca triangularis]
MHNLVNTRHAITNFESEASPLTATTWDATDDSLILAFGPSETSPALTLRRLPADGILPSDTVAITSWDAPSPNPDLPVDRILDLQYFADTRTACLVLEGGDIIVVREEPQPDEELIEIVGSVDAGIAAARWSPDEELLAVTTKADTVLFMTRAFEATASIELSTRDVEVSNHVSVGWGKSETQFKGRGAKALRDPTVPEHIDAGILSPFDDGSCTISWRGDGQYVALNSILESEPQRRIIRVYSREGILESVSEPVDGLEGALSWKPSGQLIAGIQRKGQSVDVVFFERNGLRHGEFSLRLSEQEAESVGSSISLSWNVNSSVLAVAMQERVQLWQTSNYHYYLKQEIQSGMIPAARAVSHKWHPEQALRLACHTTGALKSLAYASSASVGSLLPPSDHGLTAAIDGKQLKITALRNANIPPPYAQETLEMEQPALHAAMNKSGGIIAVLHARSISLYRCGVVQKPSNGSEFVAKCELEALEASFRQVAFCGDDTLVVLGSVASSPGSILTMFGVDGSLRRQISLERTMTTITHRTDHDRICYEDDKGAVYELEPSFDASPAMLATLPTACPTIAVWQREDHSIVFGHTSSGVLHIRSADATQSLKISGVTSFRVTSEHLVYTTSQHLLKFVHLQSAALDVPLDEPEKDERCRNVERGAKLITVMPSTFACVLQMPRGNLETIYPRALVLAGIRTCITKQNYKKAFSICRARRVDMNILYDYAPKQLIENVDAFLTQVKKVEYIDLFLSSLSEEDVTQTIYKDTLNVSGSDNLAHTQAAQPLQTIAGSKINRVCDAFLDSLRRHGFERLQNIVTAHVSKNPPDLEAGVGLVSELRKNEQDKEQLEQAIEHICFLADVNQLYDTALGLYEIEVALLIAQQSQKDPREYLPYLQSLHDMAPLRQRFSIDNDLKRYRKALSHLNVMDEFEELQNYTIKHELYSAAIDLYRYDSKKVVDLMRLYADFLSSRNRYKEAGIAFEFIGDYEHAYEEYRSGSMWREALASAALVPVAAEKLHTIASDMAESLTESKDFAAAATINLEYLSDLPAALSLLCKGHHYAEALRTTSRHKRPDLLTSIVDPGLIDSSATTTELLAEMKSQLSAQLPRLSELRQKKLEDPMAFLDGADGGDGDVPDNISLAPTDATTSAGTFMTRYTNRSTGTLATNATRKTSKNRRREERKRARGKKGTVYEEEYLVNSVGRLVERVNAVSEDVGNLVEGLMRRAMRERAVAVEGAMVEVVEVCKGCLEEVFAPAAQVVPGGDAGGGEAEGAARPWGGQGVLWEALSSSSAKKEAPVLKAFERLSLLR